MDVESSRGGRLGRGGQRLLLIFAVVQDLSTICWIITTCKPTSNRRASRLSMSYRLAIFLGLGRPVLNLGNHPKGLVMAGAVRRIWTRYRAAPGADSSSLARPSRGYPGQPTRFRPGQHRRSPRTRIL